jgi:hypothetical protein
MYSPREVPKIRALAARRWQDAQARLAVGPAQRVAQREELDAFWDWALLELLRWLIVAGGFCPMFCVRSG